MTNWRQLLLERPTACNPPSMADWKTIIDGVTDSFSRFFGASFSLHSPYFFFGPDSDSVGFDLIARANTPYRPMVYLAKGSIDLSETENGELVMVPSLFLFFFYGDKRLLAESDDGEQPEDYLCFTLLPEGFQKEREGNHWIENGWISGFPDEWKNLDDGDSFPSLVCKLVSFDPVERLNASSSYDALTDVQKRGDRVMTWEERTRKLNQLIENDALEPIMTASEFVHRILVRYLKEREDHQFNDIENKRADQTFFDWWTERNGDAPEILRKIMKQYCDGDIERNWEVELFKDFRDTQYLILFALGPLLVDATEILRWLTGKPEYRHQALDLILSMGTAAESFFKEIVQTVQDDKTDWTNYGGRFGLVIRTFPETVKKLLHMLNGSDHVLTRFAINALGSCGPREVCDLPIMNEVRQVLFELSYNAYQALVKERWICPEQLAQRNLLWDTFTASTSALAKTDRSEAVAYYFLELLNLEEEDLSPDILLSDDLRKVRNMFYYPPIWSFHEEIITDTAYFSASPEILVPRFIALLNTFQDSEEDVGKYERILKTLAVYLDTDPDAPPLWTKDTSLSEYITGTKGVYRNRHDPLYRNLPNIIASLIKSDLSDSPHFYYDANLVDFLAGFGNVAIDYVPFLEELQAKETRFYGTEFVKNNPDLAYAIERIKYEEKLT